MRPSVQVLARMRVEVPDLVLEQRQVAAEICFELGAHYEAAHEPEQVCNIYMQIYILFISVCISG